MQLSWKKLGLLSLYAHLLLVVTGCAVGSGGAFNQAWTVTERCEVFAKWARQYAERFPNTPHTIGRVANLYRDETFLPVFGTQFDQMSSEQQQKLRASVSACFDFQSYKGALFARHQYSHLVGPILGDQPRSMADFSATREDIVPIVTRTRADKKWMETAIAEAKVQPATEAGYKKMLQSWARKKEVAADLWPDESSNFESAIYEEMRRIAPSVVVARIDEAVADTSTYERVQHLKVTADDSLRLFNLVPREIRMREEARAKSALDEGVKKLIAVKAKELESRGTGLAAMKKGAVWYRDFENRYSKTFNIGKAGNDLLARFHKLRRVDLEVGKDAFLALVDNAYSLEEIDGLMNEYFLDDERNEKGGTAKVSWIETLIKKRKNGDYIMDRK